VLASSWLSSYSWWDNTWLRINDPIAFNVGYNEHLLKKGIKDYE